MIPLSFGGLPAASQPINASMLSFGAPMAAPVPVAGNPASIAIPAPQAAQPTGGIAVGPSAAGGAAADVTDPAGATEGWFKKIGGLEGIGSIFDGLGSLGQLWGAFQGVKLAREQLAFSKDAYNTNLANQTQTYNTELEDRQRARASATGASEAEIDAYLKKNSL